MAPIPLAHPSRFAASEHPIPNLFLHALVDPLGPLALAQRQKGYTHGGTGPHSESWRGPSQLDKALPDFIARADAFNAGRDRVWAVGDRFRMFFGGKKIGPHKARAGAAWRLPPGPSTLNPMLPHCKTHTQMLHHLPDSTPMTVKFTW